MLLLIIIKDFYPHFLMAFLFVHLNLIKPVMNGTFSQNATLQLQNRMVKNTDDINLRYFHSSIKTLHGSIPQILLAYSLMVRSLLNFPERSAFKIDIFAHFSLFL